MRRTAVLCEGGIGCPGKATVALSGEGHCLLAFHDDDASTVRVFPCPLSTLMDVGLGVRKEITSDHGSCLLSSSSGRILMTVSPIDGTNGMYLSSRDSFADVLMRLLEEKLERELVVA